MSVESPLVDEQAAPPEATVRRPKSIESINPATGDVIGQVPVFTEARIEACAADARVAQRSWRRLTFEERAELLLRVRDKLLVREDELVALLMRETGKVRPDALLEILLFYDTVGYYCKNGKRFLADERIRVRIFKNKRFKSTFVPRGLVVNIAPWNFPFDLAMSETVPALLAGNAVIVKPSEVTPLIAVRAAAVMREAGLPKNLLQVVTGYGKAGATLVEHADFVSFTGSVETGRKVAVACAQRLVPYTLELGGKDPLIVLEDADVERAARGAVWGAFVNAGQVCMSVERVYVTEPVYDAFVERVVALTHELRQGVDEDGNVDVGSMIDPRQIDIVKAHIDDAVSKGARVLTGGSVDSSLGSGLFFRPTVLVDVDESMEVLREETFGPVLPIRKVRDAEEALALANDSRFGLNASVWTRDMSRGNSIARELEAGAVCINDCLVSYSAVEAPYGGVKHSGVGRRRGPEGIRKYCHQKTVAEDILGLRREPIWYPYSRTMTERVGRAMRLLYRRGVGQKLAALRDLLGL
jgi:acyl-CoA reductase-like NAD-dependent aldehyde dehydrogenase